MMPHRRTDVHSRSPPASSPRAGRRSGLCCPARPRLAQVTRKPYLQNGSSTAVSVRWRTERLQQQPGLVRHHPGQPHPDGRSRQRDHRARGAPHRPRARHALLLRRGLDLRHAGGQRRQPLLRHRARPGHRPGRPGSGCWATRAPATRARPRCATPTTPSPAAATPTSGSCWATTPTTPAATARCRSNLFDVYPTMLRKSVLFPTRGNHESASSGGVALALPQPHHAHRGRGGRRGLGHRGLLRLRPRQHPLHLPRLVRLQPLGGRGHGHLAAQRPGGQRPRPGPSPTGTTRPTPRGRTTRTPRASSSRCARTSTPSSRRAGSTWC